MPQTQCLQEILSSQNEVEPRLLPASTQQHNVDVPTRLTARAVAAIQDAEGPTVADSIERQLVSAGHANPEHFSLFRGIRFAS